MNFVFVAGLPRSGTTMIQNILDTHSRVYGGPEFDRIPNIIDLRRKLIVSVNNGRINSYTDKYKIDENIRKLITELLSTVTTEKDLLYISEKTPWNILVFEDLIEIFPEAKFIHVLRNPIDVYVSMKNVATKAKNKSIKPPDFTLNVNIALRYFLGVYKLIDRLNKRHPGKVLTIKYEDVVNDLKGQSENLCEYIGVPWEKSLMEFNKKQHPGEKAMIGEGIWYNEEMYKQDPTQKTKGKSLINLTLPEKVLMNTLLSTNEFLQNNGYHIKTTMKIYERILSKYLRNKFYKKYYTDSIPIRILG